MDHHQQQRLKEITGYTFEEKIKYLGVYLTAKNVKLYKNNYIPLWTEIKKDLDHWQNYNFQY